jgi:hypothetical protein
VLLLVAQVLFVAGALGRAPRSRAWALTALVVLAVVTAPLTLVAGIAASSVVLVAVAVADTAHEDVGPPRRRRHHARLHTWTWT